MDMMEPLDLFSALTDMDDQDVVEALDIYTRNPKHRKFHKKIVVVTVLMILASAVIVTHWLLQGKTGNVDEGDESGKAYVGNVPTPTHYTVDQVSPLPPNNTPLCEIYQFVLWDENEYIASIENSNHIGSKLGTARVRNEEKESNTTLFKDVDIYEFVGVDTTIAVLVYYPEEQAYYVYYSINY